MAYGTYRALQVIVASSALYFLPAFSSSAYAMGGCPEACVNQTTINDCREMGGCYDTDNNYHKCVWIESNVPHCIADFSTATAPTDTAAAAEAPITNEQSN